MPFVEALFGAAPFACSTLEELHERVLDPRPVEVGVARSVGVARGVGVILYLNLSVMNHKLEDKYLLGYGHVSLGSHYLYTS